MTTTQKITARQEFIQNWESLKSTNLFDLTKNQRTVGKKTENSYSTGSIKGWEHSRGGNILRKWLSDQGKFSAIRAGQKLQNS